jgi:hypothetical protein
MSLRGLTIRMTPLDNGRVDAIADALRRTRGQMYVTKSAAIKFALRIIADDAERFVKADRKATAASE